MGQVRVLPDSVINLISAGEVVERPASVVKELVENAMDAGASSISVELEQGGRKSITVRDDGCGMSRHDMLLAVQRHATSKIASVEDLASIATMGFRGEALPSIAAVTHFRMVTSDGGDGWELRMDGGVLAGVSPAPRTRGTTVTAGGLFYNQPARRKFLRTQSTELSWAERFVTGCALAGTGTGFTLSHNGRVLFNLPPGESVSRRLINRFDLPEDIRYATAEGEHEGTSVSLVWFPSSLWNRKTHQYLIVNGRLVASGLLSGILESSLSGPAGHPLLCCIVRVPPGQVDVNVHPAKREVRFREVSRMVRALESALGGLMREGRSRMASGMGMERVIQGYRDYRPEASGGPELFRVAMEAQAPLEDMDRTAERGQFPIVQIGRAYLVTSTDKGIVLVDQHAAHERILFETVLKTMEQDSSSGGQTLLLPETMDLDPDELELLETYRQVLMRSGFDFRTEGSTLVLTSVPQGTFHGIDALREIIRSLRSPEYQAMAVHQRVAAAAACAGAVKFGDPLSPSEARHLVDRLFSTSDPFHCPHGRPTVLEITFDELDQRFGR
ncbi:MAG: hypothetical protein AVO35_04435 [Candidatus Aegiribacteria sp. MLS_C]|nr:MAG: hypothetical protein AVO35_04435 [Candidatus Aegiribacteria sp. MLS_C]